MRVFVTGASGWIGFAVVPELIESGHEVVGLARSDTSAAALTAAGAAVQRGDLDDLDVLRGAAADSDGVIHLAFKHEWMLGGDFQGAADADRRAVETLGDALAGSGRPLVIASGTLGVAPGRVASERDGHEAPTASVSGPETRRATAEFTLSLASRGVRSSVVRLPPTVHGDGDHGFVAALVGIARDRGVSGYIGDGTNRWPAVHRLDAGHLFRLAVESAPAGSTLHAVADEGIPISEDRRDDRPPAESSVRLGCARGRRRALHLARRPAGPRQPGLEHADAGAARLAARESRAHRRPRAGPLLRAATARDLNPRAAPLERPVFDTEAGRQQREARRNLRGRKTRPGRYIRVRSRSGGVPSELDGHEGVGGSSSPEALSMFAAKRPPAGDGIRGPGGRGRWGGCLLLAALGLTGLMSVPATSAPPPSPAPAAAPPAPVVHVSGNRLVDGSGGTVRLIGVDRSGTEYACVQGWGIFDGPSSASSVAAMRAWHIDAVRVPLNEDCWLGINGVKANLGGTAYRRAIEGYVRLLNAAGLLAILDLQWSAPGSEPATGQQVMADASHSVAFWASVARAFRTDSGVVFDLYNEPHDISWSCWRNGCVTAAGWRVAGMQQMLDAVRGAGARQPVMVEGLAWAGDLSGWMRNAPIDPFHQLVASAHVYNFGACNDPKCWNATIAPVARSLPVVTGEIGENDCASGFVDRYMDWADAHGISYLAWTWDTWNCRSGPALITSYAGTPTAYGAGVKAHLAILARGARA